MKWMFKTPRGMKMEDAFQMAAEAGYDGVEIQLYDLPDGEKWRQELKELVKKAGLAVTVHAPSGDINLTSTNQGIRRESVRQACETIRLAKELGAEAVTIHPGRLSSARETSEQQLVWMEEAAWKFSELSRQEQIFVGIENMELRSKEIYTSFEALNELLAHCPGEYMGITLDFSHLYTVDKAMDISGLHHPVRNVHISQCVGDKPHFGLGAKGGQLSVKNCLEALKRIGYEGTVVVEAKDGKSLEAAKRNVEILRKTEADCTA